MIGSTAQPAQAYDQKTAFYDAMFDSSDLAMNPIEEQAAANVRKILADPKNLSSYISPLPLIQVRLLELLEDEDVEFRDLAALIEQDPPLATRVLSIVNSPMYLTRGKAGDLMEAIKRMGVTGISQIASSVMMSGIRPHRPIYYKLFGRQIWIHSLHTALLCRGFTKERGEEEFAGHFLGLIHDVGKIIIFNCLNDAFSEGVIDGEPGSKAFKDMMSEISKDISYFIAREWKLPEKFWSALFEQTKEPTSILGTSLQQANRCAEIYLLHEKGKISGPELLESINSIGCNGTVWKDFLGKAKNMADLVA